MRMMVGQDVVRDLVFAVLAKDLVVFREISPLAARRRQSSTLKADRLINVTERPVGAISAPLAEIMFKVIRRLVG